MILSLLGLDQWMEPLEVQISSPQHSDSANTTEDTTPDKSLGIGFQLVMSRRTLSHL